MNAKTYNVLKFIAQYLLPALGTLYFALAGIWGLPKGQEVIGSLTAVDVFLGVILGVSATQYSKTQDGTMIVDTSNPLKDVYKLTLDIPLEELAAKDSINLKVDNGTTLTPITPINTIPTNTIIPPTV